MYSFFFQAEDGIRGRNVTGVQTCALPIYDTVAATSPRFVVRMPLRPKASASLTKSGPVIGVAARSEERRVGKECRFRWAPERYEKTKYRTITLRRVRDSDQLDAPQHDISR